MNVSSDHPSVAIPKRAIVWSDVLQEWMPILGRLPNCSALHRPLDSGENVLIWYRPKQPRPGARNVSRA